MELLSLLLFAAAFTCFVIAFMGKRARPNINMIAAGLAAWVLVSLVRSLIDLGVAD